MSRAATTFPVPPAIVAGAHPQRGRSGAWSRFCVSEVAFFSTLIVTYVTFMGKDVVGPTPAEALSLPLVIGTTICLLSSSVTIHLAEQALRARSAAARFCLFWAATIALGIAFLLGTAYEWHELITEHQLTISRNLFGTTYYTLVGFHGLHVTVGVITMLIVLGLALRREVTESSSHRRRTRRLVLALRRRRLDCRFPGRLRGQSEWRRMSARRKSLRRSRHGRNAETDRCADGSVAQHRAHRGGTWPRASPSCSSASCCLSSDSRCGSHNCLPGRGHWHEPRVEPAQRPQPVVAAAGEVERLRAVCPAIACDCR